MTSPSFPEPPTPIPPTPQEAVDALVDRIAAQRDAWIRVPIRERIAYLRRCMEGVLEVSEAWVQDGCRAKGIAPGDPNEGEEWVAGPWQTARNIRLLIQALEYGGQ